MNENYTISNYNVDEGTSINLNLNEYDYNHHYEFYSNLNNCILNSKITHYSNLFNKNTNETIKLISKKNIINENNIILTAGSDHALDCIINTFVKNETNVVLLTPTYDYFYLYVKKVSENVFSIPIKFDDNNEPLTLEYHFDGYSDILENSIVYIVNPNNPLGIFHNINNVETLLKKYSNSIFIIDEAYIEFVNSYEENSCVCFINKYDNIIVTRSFSKAYGLAGIRLGYLITCNKLMDFIKQLYNEKYVTDIAKSCGIFILNNIEYYNNNITKIINTRKKTEDFFKENNINFIASKTNFISFFVGNNYIKLKEIFEKNKILVRIKPNSVNMKGFIRITIGNDTNMFNALNIIKNNLNLFEKFNKTKKYFIDGCFSGYHYGHVNAFFQSKQQCDFIVAATHSDEEIIKYKGSCIFPFEERIIMLKHCRFINKVLELPVPYVTTVKILDKYNCEKFLHGDENIISINNEDPLSYIKKTNRYLTYNTTNGISTTILIKRINNYLNGEYNCPNCEDNNKYLLNIFENMKLYLKSIECYSNLLNPIYIYDTWDILCYKHINYLTTIKEENPNCRIIAIVSKNNANCIYNQIERAIIIYSIKEINDVILEDNDFYEKKISYQLLNFEFDKKKYLSKYLLFNKNENNQLY